MVADNRDKYRPKTPPPGVRAQTARDPETQRRINELQSELAELGAVPSHEITDLDAQTPVHIRHARPEVQLEYRQSRSSAEHRFVAEKIGSLESELKHVDEKIEQILKQENDKLLDLIKSEAADRKAREDRAETARLERERAQIARDSEDAKAAREIKVTSGAYRAKIILAIIGIAGTGIAGYFAGGGGGH